jgi:DNA repair exonuclease SbcCD ATPase subunit
LYLKLQLHCTVQGERTRLQRQLSLTQDEVASLKQQLHDKEGRLAAGKDRLQQQGQQLGQMEGLQPHLEELQQQILQYKEKLAAAEAEVRGWSGASGLSFCCIH